jgi:hypothetical protein
VKVGSAVEAGIGGQPPRLWRICRTRAPECPGRSRRPCPRGAFEPLTWRLRTRSEGLWVWFPPERCRSRRPGTRDVCICDRSRSPRNESHSIA